MLPRLFWTAFALSALALAADAPTFHTTISLVKADAYVYDRQTHEPILDLKASDFKILDEDESREIAYFGSDAGPLDLFSGLGLASGGNVVDNTLSNVDSISNILSDQLDQVARLTNVTLDQVSSPLGSRAQGLTGPVSELTNGLTTGLGKTLKGLVSGLRSAVPSSVVTSSVVPAPAPTEAPSR